MRIELMHYFLIIFTDTRCKVNKNRTEGEPTMAVYLLSAPYFFSIFYGLLTPQTLRRFIRAQFLVFS